MAELNYQVFTPSTSAELTAVLFEARPGDIISLLPKDYPGQFVLGPLPQQFQLAVNANGQNDQLPITLQGTKSTDFQRLTTLVSRRNPHTALRITGGKWVVTGLVVKSRYHWDFKQIGINITSDGHLVRDVLFNQDRRGLIVQGNNNRIEDIKITNSTDAITILGNGNSIKNTVLSRIKDNGIILEPTSNGTIIERTVIHMKKNVQRKNLGRVLRGLRNPKVNEGRSLLIKDNTDGTRIIASTFYGVANVMGSNTRFEGCKFLGMNLTGADNEFSNTEFSKLYRNATGIRNTIHETCTIDKQANKVVAFDSVDQ